MIFHTQLFLHMILELALLSCSDLYTSNWAHGQAGVLLPLTLL